MGDSEFSMATPTTGSDILWSSRDTHMGRGEYSTYCCLLVIRGFPLSSAWPLLLLVVTSCGSSIGGLIISMWSRGASPTVGPPCRYNESTLSSEVVWLDARLQSHVDIMIPPILLVV